ncbi:SH3 domain-containing protein [Aphanothece hegewaldii]|nr:SH3 domain-containing protein [Aphanothece hegewaldii]
MAICFLTGLLTGVISFFPLTKQVKADNYFDNYVCDGYLIWTGSENGTANVRSGASTSDPIISIVKSLKIVQVIDVVTGKDGYAWYKIRFDYTVGWVRSDLITHDEC